MPILYRLLVHRRLTQLQRLVIAKYLVLAYSLLRLQLARLRTMQLPPTRGQRNTAPLREALDSLLNFVATTQRLRTHHTAEHHAQLEHLLATHTSKQRARSGSRTEKLKKCSTAMLP